MPQLVQVGEEVVQFPDEFSQEQIQRVLRKEFPPTGQAEKPSEGAPTEKPEPKVGPLEAFLLSFGTGILPSFAARAGGRLGTLLGIESGPGLLATGFAGAVGAATAADVAERKILESTIPGYTEYEQAALRQQPWASRAGGFLSGASAFRVQPFKGISALPSFLKGTATPAQRQAAIGLGATAGLGAAAGAVSPLLEGQKPSLESIGTGLAFGLAYGQPRQFRGRLAQIASAKRLLPNAAAEATKGVVEDASRIREDERQVQAGGVEPQVREGEGRPDLEQPAPGQPGRPAPRPEAKEPQKGQPGLLLDSRPAIKLMPDEKGKVSYIDAEMKDNGEWETHDQIIERADLGTQQIDRRVFRDRLGAEKSREQVDKELAAYGVTTKVPGEAHSTDVNKLAAEPAAPAPAPKVYTLDPGKKLGGPVVSPEIDPVLDAERSAIDNPIDVVANPSDPADPFAARRGYRPGQFMGINRERGTVEIYPQEFEAWLREDVPHGTWPEAIRARLAEESLHLRTDPADAVGYWNGLSGLERYAEARIYLGKNWQARMASGEFTPQDLGFEAVRRRLQRLARMDSSEAAEASGRERWTVKGLETLSDVVRKMREGLGTKASAEQRAIIDRIAGNLDAAKAAVGQPAAIRRDRSEAFQALASEQRGLPEKAMTNVQYKAGGGNINYLVEHVGDLVHRMTQNGDVNTDRGYEATRPKIERALRRFTSRYGFQRELEDEARGNAQGLGMSLAAYQQRLDEALKQYADAHRRLPVYNELQGKARDAAVAIGEQHWGRALTLLDELNRVPKEEWIARAGEYHPPPAAIRKDKGTPEFYMPPVARGEQVERGVDIAIPEEARRMKISPVEIDWQQPGKEGAYRPISEAESRNPAELSRILTADARIAGSQLPVSSSRRLVVMVDRRNGQVHMVSAYPHGRSGAMVVNPAKAGAERPYEPIGNLLDRYKPIYSVLRDSSVKRFHQQFDDLNDYQMRFGEEAGQRSSESLGKAALAKPVGTEPSVEPVYPAEKPEPEIPTDAELKSFHDFFEGEVPATKLDFDRAMQRAAVSGTRQMAAAVAKAAKAEQAANPQASPEEHFEGALSRLYEDLTQRPTRTDFIRAAQSRLGRSLAQAVPEGKAVAGERPIQAGATEAGGPAAVRKLAGYLDLVRRDLVDMVKAKPTEQRIINGIDSASNTSNNLANQGENRARLPSAERPASLWQRLKGRWQMGNPEVLAAANVLVESVYDPARAMWRGFALRLHTNVGDFDPRAINIFRFEIERGRRRAEASLRSPDYRIQEIAKSELRAFDQYKKELDYAEAHWNDPELQETARRLRAAYNEQYRELVKRGINVSLEPGFNPHRYDAAVWNGHSYIFNMSRGARKVLGERTLANRTFDSYYHAFGNDAFLPITRDSASLLGHYLRRTNHLMFREEWRQTLKSMKTPTGEVLAAEPKHVGNKILPHNINYVIVNDGYSGMSVHQDYAKLIQRLVDPSAFEASPTLKSALSLSQQLKHTLLAGDFFHLGRMLYYANAVMGTKMGYQAGWSVLDIAPRDVPEAVRKGIIRQADADWANEQIALPRGRSMTRRDVVTKFYQEMGANLGRVQDALYKDLVTAVQPTSGPLRRAFVAVADPSVGRYNRFLFDRLTRGFMAESVAREFERQMKANPNASPKALMRDIARDVNNFFGNIGRQGWVQSKTFQDMNRLMWLAPQWVEGLIKKEAIGYSRLTGAGKALGLRQGPQQGYVRQLGTTGRAIGRGLLTMAAITQALNLISRRQPTWMNEEKEHKWDAWIPGRGADSEGFWFSPLAIFNEVSHDIYRLAMTKPTFADAITQIMGNKEQPVMRAMLVGLTGQTPMGQRTTTTPGRLKEVGKAVAPVPISFGRISQYGLSKAGVAPPPPPGSVQRQFFATLGIKIEPHGTAVQQVATLARDFMRKEGLEKTTGWQQIQTDEPGYSKLRAALRSGDDSAARRNLEALRKNRSDKDIMAAMKAWKDRGFTGSKKAEREFMHSLSDKQMDLYDKAHEQKQLLWEKFLDWFYRQP